MWLDTGNELVNLDRVARIAVVNDTHIEFMSSESNIIAEMHFDTADKVNAAYQEMKKSIGTKADDQIVSLSERFSQR